MQDLSLRTIDESTSDDNQTRIMLVDDDELVVSVLDAGLSSMGYLVKSYTQPQDALDNYQDFAPDLVILDFEMPGMNGAVLAEKMLSKMYRPIIVLSVRHDDSGWLQATEAGALNYLVKPISAVQLRPTIEATLSNYRNLADFVENDSTGDHSIPGSSSAVLDQLGFGVIVISVTLKVTKVNTKAQEMMLEIPSLVIRQGDLQLLDASFYENFKTFTASAELAVTLLLREDGVSYAVFIRRVSNESFTGFTLFLLNPESGLELSDDLVSMFYGLTGLEVRIAKSIFAGMSIEDYCTKYFVSSNTAKTQLKSVFLKTGVHSQAELVGKMAALANPLAT
jgi:DNA-binding response OmpR family regulator/DNA-binding CsgD family transcriptional regulator